MGLERVEVHRKNVFVKLSDAVLVKFLKLKKWVVLKVLCFRKCAIEVNFVAFLKLFNNGDDGSMFLHFLKIIT
jgi:hypothetical protein